MVQIPKDVVHLTTGPEVHPIFSFSLLTYNILAQDHINRPSYPYAGKYTLRWFNRKDLLATELAAYDSDIVCFQEMDRFHDFFEPLLKDLGYDVAFYLRNGPESDCNCIGWKRNLFNLIDSQQVSFEETTAAFGSVPNVAQLVALTSKSDARIKIIVATTHLYWRAECDDIRLVQMHKLIDSVMTFKAGLEGSSSDGEYIAIVAGDFNSDPDSIAMRVALQPRSFSDPSAREQILQESGLIEDELQQILGHFSSSWPSLFDAYRDYSSVVNGPNGYPLPFTSFCLYKGILDFILHTQYPSKQSRNGAISNSETSLGEQLDVSHGALRIAPTALRLLPDRSILEDEVALPNHIYPSDHLALECRFSIFHSHYDVNK